AEPPRPTGAWTPASIHELVATKESGLPRHLQYDSYERRSGLVHLLAIDADPHAFAEARAAELGDFVDGPFELIELGPGRVVVAREGAAAAPAPRAVRVEKRLSLGGDRRTPTP